MTDPNAGLLGEWVGPSTLYLEEKTFNCASTANIKYIQQGQFLQVSYTWEFEGQSQLGRILFPAALDGGSGRAAWLDTFHMQGDIWQPKLSRGEDGRVILVGTFSYPPGPDWGWRIELGLAAGSLHLLMFVITPQGEESPAVRAIYQRAA